MSLADADEGADEASVCLNTIFSLAPDKWVGGERVTMGQCVANARRDDGASWRRTLETYGLMLRRNDAKPWSETIIKRVPGGIFCIVSPTIWSICW